MAPRPGVSVEQTMLEIVAANPAAFQAGNINGLKSGYVLQIPEADDIRIDLATALDEVALQNEEWAEGVARESQGLTLVADAETATAEASEPAVGEPDSSADWGMLAEGDAEPTDEAPLDVSDVFDCSRVGGAHCDGQPTAGKRGQS